MATPKYNRYTLDMVTNVTDLIKIAKEVGMTTMVDSYQKSWGSPDELLEKFDEETYPKEYYIIKNSFSRKHLTNQICDFLDS